MMGHSEIDLQAVLALADLRQVVEADLGPADRSRKWLCPYHDDRKPSLSLSPDGRKYRCWSCGASGDAIDWIRQRQGLSLAEACAVIDPSLTPGAKPRKRARRKAASKPAVPPPPPARPPVWHDAGWQAAVEDLVARAEDVLWSPEGRPARDWLQARGITSESCRRFRFGFVPATVQSGPLGVLEGRPIRMRRGIVVPWVAPGSCYASVEAEDRRWVGANVRRLAEDDPFAPLPPEEAKYRAVPGSSRGFAYPWADQLATQGHRPALIVEGELDAVVAEQELGHLVYVATAGGAQQAPDPSALSALARSPVWLIATDADRAGVEAAWRWRRIAPHKCRRAILSAKDLGEFHQSGGDLRSWLQEELARIQKTPLDQSQPPTVYSEPCP